MKTKMSFQEKTIVDVDDESGGGGGDDGDDDDDDNDDDDDIYIGGSVAEWLERRTWNSEVPSSSPALTATELGLLSVVPISNPRPRL